MTANLQYGMNVERR